MSAFNRNAQSQAERFLLDDQKRKQILALATDFPKLWRDPATPQRERKRVVSLLVEDVTLLKSDEIAAHVRFRGGATRTLQLRLPLTAGQLRKVDPAVVAEVDRLLDEHTDAEIVHILNSRGFHPGVAERFSLNIVYTLRRTYRLEDRFTRLRRQGLLTLREICDLLEVDQSTIKKWARAGHIASRVYNDKGQRLFERPAQLHLSCKWCGGPISVRPCVRRGRKWCSQRCCLAYHGSRKRVAKVAARQEDVA